MMAIRKMLYSMAKKYFIKYDLPWEKCEIDTFQTDSCDMNFISITFTTSSVQRTTLVIGIFSKF